MRILQGFPALNTPGISTRFPPAINAENPGVAGRQSRGSSLLLPSGPRPYPLTPDSFVKPGESPSSSRRLPGGFLVGRERGVSLAAVWAGRRAADKQDGISRPTRPSAHPRGAGPSAGKPRAPATQRTRPCTHTRRGSAESLARAAQAWRGPRLAPHLGVQAAGTLRGREGEEEAACPRPPRVLPGPSAPSVSRV